MKIEVPDRFVRYQNDALMKAAKGLAEHPRWEWEVGIQWLKFGVKNNELTRRIKSTKKAIRLPDNAVPDLTDQETLTILLGRIKSVTEFWEDYEGCTLIIKGGPTFRDTSVGATIARALLWAHKVQK